MCEEKTQGDTPPLLKKNCLQLQLISGTFLLQAKGSCWQYSTVNGCSFFGKHSKATNTAPKKLLLNEVQKW